MYFYFASRTHKVLWFLLIHITWKWSKSLHSKPNFQHKKTNKTQFHISNSSIFYVIGYSERYYLTILWLLVGVKRIILFLIMKGLLYSLEYIPEIVFEIFTKAASFVKAQIRTFKVFLACRLFVPTKQSRRRYYILCCCSRVKDYTYDLEVVAFPYKLYRMRR